MATSTAAPARLPRTLGLWSSVALVVGIIYPALLQALQPLGGIGGMHHLEAEPRQAAVDQPGQAFIVVDVQQCRHRWTHGAAGGT